MPVLFTRRDMLIGVSASVGTLTSASMKALAGSPKTHDVVIRSFKFEPERIEVKAGDTIRWTNEDLAPHTATATDGGWDTGEITKGQNRSIVVTDEMELQYFCAYHPHMKAVIELK